MNRRNFLALAGAAVAGLAFRRYGATMLETAAPTNEVLYSAEMSYGSFDTMLEAVMGATWTGKREFFVEPTLGL